jgi:hypothetical protein
MLLISLVMLVAASVTAALSDSPAPMITGRALQGPGHDRHARVALGRDPHHSARRQPAPGPASDTDHPYEKTPSQLRFRS